MKNKYPETMQEAVEYENARIAPSLDRRLADPFSPHLFLGKNIPVLISNEAGCYLVAGGQSLEITDDTVEHWLVEIARHEATQERFDTYAFPENYEFPEEPGLGL